jgi:Co/Zn/Cd efflux system component
MGALVVNVISAAMLLKHRIGDANVQAVWLFSRNDALGNVAVVVAAASVWLTAMPWPDLIAPAVVTLLFLQSAWKIVKSARQQLLRLPSSSSSRSTMGRLQS